MQGRKTRPSEAIYGRWTSFISGIFSGMTARERILSLTGLALTAVTAYFAADKGIPFLPDGAGGGISRPLGDALLCASGYTAPAAFLGLIYSAYVNGDGFLPRLAALVIIFGLRTVISADIGDKNGDKWGFYRVKASFYQERATVKIGISAAFSLLALGMRLPSVPLTAESLPELISILFVTPALTALLCGAFEGKSSFDTVNHRVLYSVYREISLYGLPFLAVYSFKEHAFAGSSLAIIAAVFFTVVTAVKGGTVRGAIMGALLGATVSAAYAPIATVIGVFSGVLSGLGVNAAVGISCAAGCIVAVYAYGYRGITAYVPSVIIAAAIASPVVRYGFIGDSFPIPRKRIGREGSPEAEGDVAESSISITALSQLSEAFYKLSSEGYERDDRKRIPDTEQVCRSLKSGFCDSCPLVCVCWDNRGNRRRAAFDAVKKRILQIYRDKRPIDDVVTEEDDAHFRCLRSRELTREVIRLCESPDIKSKETSRLQSGFFAECRYLSEILGELSDSGTDFEYDAALTKKMKKAIISAGVNAEDAAMFGSRIKTAVIYGVNTDHSTAFSEKTERIAAAISERCGESFVAVTDESGICSAIRGKSRKNSSENGKNRLVFTSVPKLTATCACVQSKATGEDENGDSVMTLETDNGYFYSAICDGMGSGTRAARCSEDAVNTLKTLLRCRLSPALSAKLTGDAVKDGYDECFTTLDLFTADLTSGEASVIKCGAADSYLLRNGEVRRLSLPSLPLGLAYGTDVEKIGLWLKDGDVLVTVSDGVVEEEADENRLADLLPAIANTPDCAPEEIAERILTAANDSSDRRARRDDMTVAVIKIAER